MGRLIAAVFAIAFVALWGTGTARAKPPAPQQITQQNASEGQTAALDLNTASAAQLEELPGIGPSRAQAILAFREAHGGFTQVSQLMRIKGIGRAMLRKLRAFVTVGAQPAARANAHGGSTVGTGSGGPHRLP